MAKRKQIEPCPYCSADVQVKKSSIDETGYSFEWHPPAENWPSFTSDGKTYCEGSGAPALGTVERKREGW